MAVVVCNDLLQHWWCFWVGTCQNKESLRWCMYLMLATKWTYDDYCTIQCKYCSFDAWGVILSSFCAREVPIHCSCRPQHQPHQPPLTLVCGFFSYILIVWLFWRILEFRLCCGGWMAVVMKETATQVITSNRLYLSQSVTRSPSHLRVW